MRPPHPAADRLHLDTLWWTAGAETSERGIYCRAYRARSSRLPSLPQASRSYALPPPMPRLAHSGCQQSRALPPSLVQVLLFPTPTSLDADVSLLVTTSFQSLCGFAAIFHAVTGTRNGNDLRMMKEPVKQRGRKDLITRRSFPLRVPVTA